jgi:23S rRNA (pseudouridine1915-N3)-methyltransferase
VKLTIVSVGRLKAGAEQSLCDDYVKRLGGLGRTAGISQLKIAEFAESQAATAKLRQQEEAALVTKALPPRAHRIILDERGEPLASEAFSKLLQTHMDQGTGDVAFMIGGPDGHTPELRTSGQLLSFGPMTWPHRLVRVMLLEQIYRAVTIMLNHPYHRA